MFRPWYYTVADSVYYYHMRDLEDQINKEIKVTILQFEWISNFFPVKKYWKQVIIPKEVIQLINNIIQPNYIYHSNRAEDIHIAVSPLFYMNDVRKYFDIPSDLGVDDGTITRISNNQRFVQKQDGRQFIFHIIKKDDNMLYLQVSIY